MLSSTNAEVSSWGTYAQGNPASFTDGNGVQTQYAYDASNLYLKTVTEAYGTSLARSTSYVYDTNTGLPSSTTDYNGLTRTWVRDPLGREIQVDESGPGGLLRRTTTSYEDGNRRVVRRTDAVSPGDVARVSVVSYGQLGRVRLSRQLEGSSQGVDDETAGIKVVTRYRTLGAGYRLVSNPFRAATTVLAAGESAMGWTLVTMDRNGRPVSTQTFGAASDGSQPWPFGGSTVAANGGTTVSYSGATTTTTDAAGSSWADTVDGLGRLASVVENGISATTGYGYDAQGNVVSVTQAGVNARGFTYDSLGRLKSATNPESGTTSYVYDANGNLWSRTDALGIVVSYVYDALNRLKEKDYTVGGVLSTAAAYSYSGQTGMLMSVVSPGATYNYWNYDALGRPGAGSQVVGSQTWTFPSVVWTPSGEVKSLTYPSGRVVATGFDGAGRILSVTGSAGGVSTPYVSGAGYAAHGGLASWTTADGLGHSISYNSRVQPVSIIAGSLLALALAYPAAGNNGNVASQSVVRGGVSVGTQVYGYDGVNRLRSAAEGSNWSQWYAYDKAGNRAVVYNGTGQTSSIPVSNNTPQTATTTGTVPFDGNNRWSGAGYDAAGNMTSMRTQTMGYDAESRMVSWSDSSAGGGTATVAYDGDGRRVTKTSSVSGTTTYVYDPAGNLAVEVGGAAAAASSTVYLTRDHLGSTRLVTSSGGGCVGAHDYLPFGEEVPAAWGRSGVGCYSATDATTVKFTGKERDAETGLDYFGARYMSSAQGRFTSPDPLGAAAGKEGDPQSWNLYGYSRNNPLLYVDPDGLTFRICDTSGNCDDNYSDANFYQNLNKTSKNGLIYDTNGTQIGTYQRTSFDDLGPAGNSLYFGMAARRKASNQAIGAFAVASVVAGTGVGIGLQATGGAGLTTLDSAVPYFRYTPGQLNQLIGGAQRELLKDLFGQGQHGAASRLANFRLPEGLTKETLEVYKEAAQRVVQRGPGAPGFEVQKLRLEIVQKALSLLTK